MNITSIYKFISNKLSLIGIISLLGLMIMYPNQTINTSLVKSLDVRYQRDIDLTYNHSIQDKWDAYFELEPTLKNDYNVYHINRLQLTFQIIQEVISLRDRSILCLGEKGLVLYHLLRINADVSATAIDDTGDIHFNSINKRATIKSFNVEKTLWPYPDNHFDFILSFEMFEHLRYDPNRISIESNRVLKANGRFIISTPNASGLRTLIKLLKGETPSTFSSYMLWGTTLAGVSHPKEWGYNDLHRWSQNGGFNIVKHITYNPYGNDDFLCTNHMVLCQFLYDQGSEIAKGHCGSTQLIILQKGTGVKNRVYEPLYWTGGHMIEINTILSTMLLE